MRVAVLTGLLSRGAGGLFWSVRYLSAGLKSRGLDVVVFGLRDKENIKDIEKWKPCEVYSSMYVGIKSFGFSLDLGRLVKRHSFDILHLHGLWMYSSIVSLFISRKGIPVVISPRGMLDRWAIENSSLKKKVASFFFESKNLKNASCLHALCQSEYESIREYGLINPVAIIPNAVNFPTKESGSREGFYYENGIQKGKKVLLYLGRIHKKKGLDEFIDALSFVNNENKNIFNDWVFAICGWGQNGHDLELKQQCFDLGLEDKVFFLGGCFGEEKERAMRQASAFVLPSKSEGMPMSVLEAWSYSLPSLITNECNIPIAFDRNAAISLSGNDSSIADGIKIMLKMDSIEMDRMGSEAASLVKEKFSWDVVSKDMELVYKWLVGSCDRPSCVKVD